MFQISISTDGVRLYPGENRRTHQRIPSTAVSAGPEIILKPTRFFFEATRGLVTAMEEAQVKRLICVTALAVRLAHRHRGPCRYPGDAAIEQKC